jgi:type I restriction enzyme S subunit
MIADLKPYAKYKESGLPWIGTMPAHWDARRLRHACEMRVSNVDKHTKKGEIPVRLCNYVDAYKNERIKESLRFMLASATKDELARFRLHKLDVVITKDSEDWKDIGVPSLVEYEAQDLVCGYHLAILRPRLALNGAFLHRALQCHFIAVQLRIEANGVTRYGLSHGAILGVSIPLPSLEEQTAIVRFLDWANGRLERAIRAKRKVIALLNEQKQAIIHRAVTRGLDPSVPLKPSGIPWLGDIPLHWEVKKLKHISPQITVGIVVQPARFYVSSGVPALRSLNISSGKITSDRLIHISEEGHLANRKSRLSEGDVVAVRTGRTGVAVVVPPAFNGANCIDLLIIRKSQSLLSEYLLMYFRSYGAKEDISFNSVGAIQAHYNTGTLANLRIPLPSVSEQGQILSACQSQLAPIDTAISRLEREIDLLREYRTRLVADVVTGKLDVREAAAKLPVEEQADEPGEELVEDDSEMIGDDIAEPVG